jgi:NAD(P)-dependent dehydrogenase (short-subunit alcohol dehydrogenase family)
MEKIVDASLPLSGRRVLVTGAGSGIGRAIAELAARQGARVALVGRTLSKLEEVARAIGGTAIVADVTQESDARNAIARAVDALGGLDGLVNAAGSTHTHKTTETTLDLWQQMVDIHMTATFLMCREAIPALREQPNAAIVNISSVAGLLPGISGAAYAAAKGGQIVFSRALAVELAPRVRVNTMCAGPTETALSRPNIDAIRKAGGYDKFISLFPLARIAEPMEIAEVVTFLLSARASFVTGAVWTADGGRSLH